VCGPRWFLSSGVSTAKGYEVRGIKRRTTFFNTEHIDHIYENYLVHNNRFHLHYVGLSDSSNLTNNCNVGTSGAT
jgi:GDP-D-mannose dehydratase